LATPLPVQDSVMTLFFFFFFFKKKIFILHQ